MDLFSIAKACPTYAPQANVNLHQSYQKVSPIRTYTCTIISHKVHLMFCITQNQQKESFSALYSNVKQPPSPMHPRTTAPTPT
mmetsp:Transcript_38154/g.65170  ORF Transcript_38154/g.65170 Transcript_38154/m.65170 type:complete len:83 (-) Transcript_38154:357-605(-)